MANYKDAKELSSLSLGKSTEYVSSYTPELLQPVPRSLNRDDINLKGDNLPFHGEDVWYGYELSWLNTKGKPQVAVAEYRISCTSPNIVESKSFKLYLNSFNQTKFESWQDVQNKMTSDLSEIAGSPIEVALFNVDNCAPFQIQSSKAFCIDEIDVTIEDFDYQQSILDNIIEEETTTYESLVSHLLKSNCLITNQPDWATIYIDYKGPKLDHATLLKYLVSFRQHNEFHEQCVERIFTDLMKFANCEKLTVFARYTRRGGLDINPYRSTEPGKAPNLRTYRQ